MYMFYNNKKQENHITKLHNAVNDIINSYLEKDLQLVKESEVEYEQE